MPRVVNLTHEGHVQIRRELILSSKINQFIEAADVFPVTGLQLGRSPHNANK